MTNKQAPVALRLAEELEHDPGINRPSVVAELRRLYAENTALQQGYDAARMEIDGLRDRVQELGAMLRENCNRRIVELEAQLEAIGAGGVEPLRRRECLHQISEPAAATRIQQPYNLAEIKAKIASNDYSAELLLQHAMLLLEKPAAVTVPEEQNESAYQRGYMDGMAKGRRDAEAAPQQEAQKPYAYAVYFPDQPTVELVHDLDELTDDLTNREHQITKLYTAPQAAPVRGYPPLPRVGPIGYASVIDIQSYVTRLTIGPRLVGVRDVALWTTDQMRAYVDADRAMRAQAAPAAQGDAEDAARLDWLLLHISGAEFRRIGVHYSGNARRADVDAARKQGANHD